MDWTVEPTTITSIVLVLLGLATLTYSAWTWFGDWQPEPRRVRVDDEPADIDSAVDDFRHAIDQWERRRRSG